MSNNSTPSYIVIEGPIGIGKTTLAKKLAERFNAEQIFEEAEENPFLDKFYSEPENGALPAQLFFLFNRHKQLKKACQADMFSPTIISDFLFEKDRLFARLTLSEDELTLYEQVYNNLSVQQVQPDLVIYLQAQPGTLIKRIRQRGRANERGINPLYLEEICGAYTEFFHYYDQSPVLIVNSSGLDIVNNEAHLDELIEQIRQPNTGRQYFNPVSL
jgi:deoxyguanosine kinase